MSATLTHTDDALENDPWIGRTLAGEFQIIARIGAGLQGTVYRATQRPFGRQVAIKILRGQAFANPQARARFLREAQVLGLMTDPGIVRLLRFGYVPPADGLPGCLYLAQELVNGRSLRDVLNEEGALEPARALRIALQIAGALADAHRIGVVHRDLKPPHVLLTTDALGVERVKVIDFGMAHLTAPVDGDAVEGEREELTQVGFVLGSPRYMAPEPLRGQKVSPSVDQYALGTMLYEMVKGVPPFAGGAKAVLRAKLSGPLPKLPENLALRDTLNRIIAQATAQTPTERYFDVTALAVDLEEALAELEDEEGETRVDAPSEELLALLTTEEMPQAEPVAPRPVHRRVSNAIIGALVGATTVFASAAAAATLLF